MDMVAQRLYALILPIPTISYPAAWFRFERRFLGISLPAKRYPVYNLTVEWEELN